MSKTCVDPVHRSLVDINEGIVELGKSHALTICLGHPLTYMTVLREEAQSNVGQLAETKFRTPGDVNDCPKEQIMVEHMC